MQQVQYEPYLLCSDSLERLKACIDSQKQKASVESMRQVVRMLISSRIGPGSVDLDWKSVLPLALVRWTFFYRALFDDGRDSILKNQRQSCSSSTLKRNNQPGNVPEACNGPDMVGIDCSYVHRRLVAVASQLLLFGFFAFQE